MFSSAAKASRVSHLSCIAVALTLLLAPTSYAKKASFDMPTCDKLTDGTGPNQATPAVAAPPVGEMKVTTEADDNESTTVITPAMPPVSTKGGGKGKSLEPVKLTEDQPAYTVGKDGKMKVKVQKNVKKKEEENPQDKMVSDAKKVNITPLALMETDSEAQQKLDAVGEAEKQQLTDLWAATINRSPDVQFVIQRMQPHSDPNHATSTVIKVLSGALFSAAQAVPLMMGPGMGSMAGMAMYSGTSSGVGMLQNLMGAKDAKAAKKQQISQEQATMLYKMVRETADKLVCSFRNYKKCRAQYEKASADLEDLKGMVESAVEGQPPAEIIKMQYFVRKAARELDSVTDDAKVQRQALSDLAGNEAVAKLDDQVDEEIQMVKNMTGGHDKQLVAPVDLPH
jgi:hypothetical protein